MSAGILSPGSILSPLVRITGSHYPGLLPLMVSLARILAAEAGFFLTEANNLPLLDTIQKKEKSWDPPHTTPCGLCRGSRQKQPAGVISSLAGAGAVGEPLAHVRTLGQSPLCLTLHL